MKKMIVGLVAGLLIGTTGTAIAAQTETVQAVFAKFNVKIDSKQPTEVEALVYDGTSYYPIRVIADILGHDVGYDDSSRTINLSAEKKTNVQETNSVTGIRELLETLGRKYPELTPDKNGGKSKISFVPYENTLYFQDKKYVLNPIGEGRFDAKPLIDAGILTAEDIQ
ncbi:stalk domain-containing protein [Paenibacillus sp. HJGM_3]|uniref:stalk domain-containing protein n=1 Tax=Paenibacillus sp. HJGM_3 TaxID=3379816 RepID=UPI003859D1A4